MNKTELIEALAEKANFTKADARRIIDALFAPDTGILASQLQAEERVQITGFGTFETRERKGRFAQNPQTGEKMRIPASTAVSFRTGKGLKEAVQNGETGPPPTKEKKR